MKLEIFSAAVTETLPSEYVEGGAVVTILLLFTFASYKAISWIAERVKSDEKKVSELEAELLEKEARAEAEEQKLRAKVEAQAAQITDLLVRVAILESELAHRENNPIKNLQEGTGWENMT